MFEIEKNVPAPTMSPFPFAKMAVGDSFKVPEDMANKVRAAAASFAKRNDGFQFSVRRVDNVYRCWRVNGE